MDRLRALISFLDATFAWLPDWALSLVVIAVAILLALWLHALLFRNLERWVSGQDLFRRSLVSRTTGPARLAVVMAAVALATAIAPLANDRLVRQIMIVGIVVLAGWTVSTALHVWMVLYLRRFKLDSEDNLLARKHVTQSRILERVARVLIVILTVAAALMTFDDVRQVGISLLASAGAASLVLGLALQPVLRNLMAGVQLAITQPIRIDDALLIEGEWGNVEEITASYVVVRLWDWRRLIVPLSYFIEQPFQNWTRESSALIGTVFLYVDYTVPVEDLRRELERIVRASPLWDKRVVNLQVTDFKENTMEIRMLMSASTAGRTFDLRCEVREKMIAYVQKCHPEALPRTRTDRVEERRDAKANVKTATAH
ncbi:mechanosensitive ion channel family protein [Methyloceanibacter sp.]|uniref:mechanosensitive ion channel family protein n=1 Tax=Methyloceanibacter sp. TaxID=1965321 RepID=UPI002D28A950|nr:mechanosensitive ion channel domain-containing protein [Methyloceanibacter sp.]HZP08873.1 mechanosensitive ion channel domain-containing protein [Methyloceanibacter sp.]